MHPSTRTIAMTLKAVAATTLLASCANMPATGPMGFFVTSAGPGNGADLGGLAGADAHCQKLATAVGAGARTWRAYLSTGWTSTTPVVNARDRIGKGPWYNVKGELIATDVTQLHNGKTVSQVAKSRRKVHRKPGGKRARP